MLDHKNIIKLHQTFLYGKDYVLIMEYASGGELTDYVREKGRLDEIEC